MNYANDQHSIQFTEGIEIKPKNAFSVLIFFNIFYILINKYSIVIGVYCIYGLCLYAVCCDILNFDIRMQNHELENIFRLENIVQ